MKLKHIIAAILALVILTAVAACAKEQAPPDPNKTTAPRGEKRVDEVQSMAPTASPPPRTPEPSREDMQLAIVKKAKAKDGTVTLEFYNEADSKMVKTGETKTVKVDENSYIMFGNIFIYKGLGKFTNKKVDNAFFFENATEKYEGEPLYFFVQIEGDTLVYAELYFEHHLGE